MLLSMNANVKQKIKKIHPYIPAYLRNFYVKQNFLYKTLYIAVNMMYLIIVN
jgi:hypothetical protein